MNHSPISAIAKRLMPGVDLRAALEAIAHAHTLKAGVLLSVVGSLTKATLRTASSTLKNFDGPLEIVAGTGTIGSGGLHIHLSVAAESGAVVGGHLVPGCIIRTTAEVVIYDLSEAMIFERELDSETGYLELVVKSLKN
jgi:predicted DNA-binding protein with PD1-like motif